MEHPDTTTRVLYNGDCPVCSFEIGHYRRYCDTHSVAVRFDDLNTADLARWGLDPDQAARRLYVLKDGVLVSGIAAFLVLWSDMPRYRWLSRIVALPGLRQAAEITYDRVLAPLIYRWHRARLARRRPATR